MKYVRFEGPNLGGWIAGDEQGQLYKASDSRNRRMIKERLRESVCGRNYHFRRSPRGLCAWNVNRLIEQSMLWPRRVPLSGPVLGFGDSWAWPLFIRFCGKEQGCFALGLGYASIPAVINILILHAVNCEQRTNAGI
jgi:hypothetical protein